MRVFRVYPHFSGAKREAFGHALHRSAAQGAGRIDNPERYRTLYVAHDPVTAVAEKFFHEPSPWDKNIFYRPDKLPYHLAALAFAESSTICNLDDARSLVERSLKPSDVATRDRARTQSWALKLFEEGSWQGISWWSLHDADVRVAGVWNLRGARVVVTDPLTLRHPAVIAAAELLNRQILL